MSFRGNLLTKSSYLPRFISLVPSKQQQSQISSEDEQNHISNNGNKDGKRNNMMKNNDSESIVLQSKVNQPQRRAQNLGQVCKNHTSHYIPTKKPKFDNLLHAPSKDYQQKSAMFQQRRIEQQIRKKHQREMYYGKRKNQIVEISDVSSEEQQEQKRQKNTKKRLMQEVDYQEDQLLRRYGIQKQDLKNQKNRKDKKSITKISDSNPRIIKIPSQSENRNKTRNKSNKQDEKQNHQEQNILEHLNPDFQEELKPALSDHEDSSQEMSEIDSDKSIIVIKRKKKHTHKRLRKMGHVTNKVKIQNEQNSGETHQCPICLTDLNKKVEKKKGKLPCNHLFCLKCITQSSKFANRCPYCRASYNEIMSNGRRIEVQDTHYTEQYEDPDDQPCYICGRNDDFERLLECDFCEYAYCHTYCDPRLNNRRQLPEDVWHCASCEQLLRQRDQNGELFEQGGEYGVNQRQEQEQQNQNQDQIELQNYSNEQNENEEQN